MVLVKLWLRVGTTSQASAFNKDGDIDAGRSLHFHQPRMGGSVLQLTEGYWKYPSVGGLDGRSLLCLPVLVIMANIRV